MGKTMVEQELSPDEEDSLREFMQEVFKKPPCKSKKKNKEGARSNKVSSIKKIPSPQKRTSLKREKSQTQWRRCETMLICTPLMNNLIRKLILK
jgi:hypothetical protein